MRKYQFTRERLKYLMIRQKINWKVEKIFKPIYFAYNFGPRFTMSILHEKDRLRYMEACYDYLKEDFNDVLESYKKKFRNAKIEGKSSDRNIWICWFQGEGEMPEIVQTCIASVKKNCPVDVKVNIITVDNIFQYVNFPEHILKKVFKGQITLTHFSDMLRFELLSRYGGLWIDATVFVGKKIAPELFDKPLYSIQYPRGEEAGRNDFYGALTSFLIGGTINSTSQLLFEFILEFFYKYWERYNILLDWHLINLVYALAYRNIPEVRLLIDQIGPSDNQVQVLSQIANDAYDKETWDNLMCSQCFHKMNWRKKYQDKTESGKETVYYMMKKQAED